MNAAVPPSAVIWMPRYLAGIALVKFLAAGLGPIFVMRRESIALELGTDPTAFGFFGVLWTMTWLFLGGVHLVARSTPRSPFAWRIIAVILAIDLTTLVLWPAALPMLWYWLKTPAKEWYGVQGR